MGPLSVNGSHPGPTSRKLIRLQRGDVVGCINIKSSCFVSSKLRNLGISGERLEKVVVVRQNFAILASQERERVESVMVAWKSVINH